MPTTPPYIYQYIDPVAIDNSADKSLHTLQSIVNVVNLDVSAYTTNNASVVLALVDMSVTTTPMAVSYDINLLTPVSVTTQLLNVVFEGTDLQYLIHGYLMPVRMVNDAGLSNVLKRIFKDISIMKLLLDAKNYVTPVPPVGPGA